MPNRPPHRPRSRPVPRARARLRSFLWWIGGLALITLIGWFTPLRPAFAQPASGEAAPTVPLVEAQVRALAGAPAAGQRVEVQIGALDPRLRLAPCARIEPYVPPGARLWGRSRVGMRCVDGPVRWNVSVPVTVRVFATALVASTPIAAGTRLAGTEFVAAEVDLAEEPGEALTDARPLAGRILARPLRAGQALRASHLRPRQWFAAGDTVQLSAVGSGFRIGGLAQALTPGIEGQNARVRTESGRVLTGTPSGNGRIEVRL